MQHTYFARHFENENLARRHLTKYIRLPRMVEFKYRLIVTIYSCSYSIEQSRKFNLGLHYSARLNTIKDSKIIFQT